MHVCPADVVINSNEMKSGDFCKISVSTKLDIYTCSLYITKNNDYSLKQLIETLSDLCTFTTIKSDSITSQNKSFWGWEIASFIHENTIGLESELKSAWIYCKLFWTLFSFNFYYRYLNRI